MGAWTKDISDAIGGLLGKKEFDPHVLIVAYPGREKGIDPENLPAIVTFGHLQASAFNGLLIGFTAIICWLRMVMIYNSVKFGMFQSFLVFISIVFIGLFLWLARGVGSALAVWVNVPMEDRELALYLSPRTYLKNTAFHGIRFARYTYQVLWGKRGEIPLEKQLAISTFLSRFFFLTMVLFPMHNHGVLTRLIIALNNSIRGALHFSPFNARITLSLMVLAGMFLSIMFNTYAANIRGLLTKNIRIITNNCAIWRVVLNLLFIFGMAIGLGLLKRSPLLIILITGLGFLEFTAFYIKGMGTFKNAPDLRFYWLLKFYEIVSKVPTAYSRVAYGLFFLGALMFYFFTKRFAPYDGTNMEITAYGYLYSYLLFSVGFSFLGFFWRHLCAMLGGGRIVYFAFKALFYTALLFVIRQLLLYYGVFVPLQPWDLYVLGVWAMTVGFFAAAIAHGIKALYNPLLLNKPLEQERMGARRWIDLQMLILPTYPEPSSSKWWEEFKDWFIFAATISIIYILSYLLKDSGFLKFFPYPGIYFVMILLLLGRELILTSSNTREINGLAFMTRGPHLYESHCIVDLIRLEGGTGIFWGYDYLNFMAWRLF